MLSITNWTCCSQRESKGHSVSANRQDARRRDKLGTAHFFATHRPIQRKRLIRKAAGDFSLPASSSVSAANRTSDWLDHQIDLINLVQLDCWHRRRRCDCPERAFRSIEIELCVDDGGCERKRGIKARLSHLHTMSMDQSASSENADCQTRALSAAVSTHPTDYPLLFSLFPLLSAMSVITVGKRSHRAWKKVNRFPQDKAFA